MRLCRNVVACVDRWGDRGSRVDSVVVRDEPAAGIEIAVSISAFRRLAWGEVSPDDREMVGETGSRFHL